MSKAGWIVVVCGALGACSDDPEAELGALQLASDETPAYAVHLRGEGSAGVGLLDADGALLRDLYVHSGTEAPGLSEFLHADFSLPSSPEADGVLALIARAPKNYVMRLDYRTGEVRSQFKTQLSEVGEDLAAWSSNPYDYLLLDEERAFVTRYEPNLDPQAAELDRGDDVVLINPSTGELLARIDLGVFREDIQYTYIVDFETGETAEGQGTAYARPNHMLRVGEYALIGLDRLTGDFGGAADGALALLSLAENTVEPVPLPGAKNCGNLSPVAGRQDAVLVSCVGQPWGSPETSGLFLVSVNAGMATIEQSYRPSAGGPLAVFSPVSLGGTQAVATESGWATFGADVLYLVDLASGQTTEIARYEVGGTIAFGGAFDLEKGLLVLGDRTQSRVLRFSFEAGVAGELEPIQFDPALPVDGVYAL